MSEYVFCYGTLKQGYARHWLLQKQIYSGNASFVDNAITSKPYPLILRKILIPSLINFPNMGKYVKGEVYQVSKEVLKALDVGNKRWKALYKFGKIEVKLQSGSLLVANTYFLTGGKMNIKDLSAENFIDDYNGEL